MLDRKPTNQPTLGRESKSNRKSMQLVIFILVREKERMNGSKATMRIHLLHFRIRNKSKVGPK
jgi:putative heme iron utilization protein